MLAVWNRPTAWLEELPISLHPVVLYAHNQSGTGADTSGVSLQAYGRSEGLGAWFRG